jgi:hypothetical protein
MKVVLIIKQLVSFSHRVDKLAKEQLFTISVVGVTYHSQQQHKYSSFTLSNTT